MRDATAVPEMLARSPVPGVVGPEPEHERLRRELDLAVSGESRRVVLLSGEAGIGKTTLAGAIAREAASAGTTVLYGGCDEDVGIPYLAFREALGNHLDRASDDVLASIGPRRLAELARLLPRIRVRQPTLPEATSSDPDAERYLLFRAVAATLEELASQAPLVVVLDDLHWADPATLLLLRHVLSAAAGARMLIVGTFRDTELDGNPTLADLLAGLRTEPSVTRIALQGLDDAGVLALLRGLADDELDADGVAFAEAVGRDTAGNPFFTTEIGRHHLEADGATTDTPMSVREVLQRRVSRLGPDAEEVVAAASVLGREFDLALLADVVGRDGNDVIAVLERAAAAAVVVELAGRVDGFAFRHALFQRTAYEQMTAARRARLHRRAGEQLERAWLDGSTDRVAELARHWGLTSDHARAARYAGLAGDQAIAALAPHEAVRWYTAQVARLHDDAGHDAHAEVGARIALGDALRQSGDASFREVLLAAADHAHALGDTDALVAAALANQRGMVSNVGWVDDARIAVLDDALAAIADDDSPARALLLATLGSELTFSSDRARRHLCAAEAEAMARRLGDPAVLLRVLNTVFMPRWVPDSIERTLAVSDEALTLAADLGDPAAEYWAAQGRFFAMGSANDVDGMTVALERSAAIADLLGQPYLQWLVMGGRSWLAFARGDVDDAERRADEALQLGLDAGQPDALIAYGAHLAAVRWHQGRIDEIVPLLGQAADENPALPSFRAAQAAFLCEVGDRERASEIFETARAADFHDEMYDYIWLTHTTLWADAAATLEDRDAATTLFDRLAPYASQGIVSNGNYIGCVSQYLARLAAVLGHIDEAERLHEDADARLCSGFLRARNLVFWAETTPDVGRAATLRDRAATLAAECGAPAIAARARAQRSAD